MDAIAARIREILEATGWSERELSSRAGLSPVHVGKILDRGGERTGGDTLARIAAAAGVTLDWLVTGRGPRTPSAAAQHTGESAAPLLGNARGWAEVEAAYRARHPDKYPPQAYELARNSAFSSVPDPVTEDFLADVVMVLWKHHRDPSIAARQQKRLDATAKGLVTRKERATAAARSALASAATQPARPGRRAARDARTPPLPLGAARGRKERKGGG